MKGWWWQLAGITAFQSILWLTLGESETDNDIAEMLTIDGSIDPLVKSSDFSLFWGPANSID